jgi:DNA-binding LacI/PurR family transcriptional regulator
VIGRRATIDDVARAAGVSRQTVSNLVRDRGRLASATRDRVLAAIGELGYKPHTGAASLRSGRTYRLAHPIPDAELHPGNVIMLEFLQFLVAAARERKHQVLVTGSYGSGLEAIEELVWTKSVDGFVLATMAGDDPREPGVPGRAPGSLRVLRPHEPGYAQHWVDIDNGAAIRDVTARVLTRGHTSVACLGYTPQGEWDLEREAG